MPSAVTTRSPATASILGATLPRRMLRRHSLRLRLPLVITTLVAIVLALFLFAAQRELWGAALQSGGERSLAAAVQLADILGQSVRRTGIELQRLAADPAVHQYLRTPTDDLRVSLELRLKAVATAGQPPVVVLSQAGERLLQIAPASALPEPIAQMPLSSGVPAHTGIGALQIHNGLVFADVVVPIRAPTEAATADEAPLGFIVIRRIIQAGPNADVLARLLGTGARVAVGNRTGNVWTDFTGPITGAPTDAHRTRITTETGAGASSPVGGLAVIEGAPWAVWVEFPRNLVLAPARLVIARMMLLGVALVVVAAVAVTVLSRHVTKPLNDLTQVSEAIAAGEHSRRVKAVRRDEIGRLGAAFNTMADRLAEHHRELEGRVQRRTASLEEASAELDRFFALSPDMLCIANMEGRFVRVNEAWHDTLGWTAAELTAVPYSQFVHPDDVGVTTSETDKLADGHSTRSFENRYRCKDGSYRVLSWRAAPIVSRGLIFAAARDVTERRRVARELEDRATALATVNQELEAFTYSVSHDLRAPLRHITGFATMLQESAASKLDDQERRRLEKVTEASNRMGRLIDDLLAFSKMGRSVVNRGRVSLDHVIREARQELSMDPDSQRVTWTVHALPEVAGDASMLKQVFVNLLSNATKYSRPRPDPTIEIGTTEERNGHTVVFVRDNGVGFDMQYSDKLFGVFQRLHSSDSFEGTGIGLASVRRVVHKHGGRIWAEGAVNQGATFYVSLPNEKGEPAA